NTAGDTVVRVDAAREPVVVGPIDGYEARRAAMIADRACGEVVAFEDPSRALQHEWRRFEAGALGCIDRIEMRIRSPRAAGGGIPYRIAAEAAHRQGPARPEGFSGALPVSGGAGIHISLLGGIARDEVLPEIGIEELDDHFDRARRDDEEPGNA